MNETTRKWLDLKNEVMNALENHGLGILDAIDAWDKTYRPLIAETLKFTGNYSVTIGDRVIEWSVKHEYNV